MLGTFVVVSAYGEDRVKTLRAIGAAFEEFRKVDALMSLHRADSELARLNAHASQGPVAVSSNLFYVIRRACQISAQTDGAFDITIRPLVQLWGFLDRNYRLPEAEPIGRAMSQVGYRWIELDERAGTVRFRREGLSIDLGGIAKGFAVDCAVDRLHCLGISNLMIRAGGDLRVTGAPPEGGPWIVQLEDPLKGGHRVWIPLRAGAVSTSGNYENYFEIQGRRFGHILDPRTGWPVEGMVACTVLAPTCLESDAWATAGFVLGNQAFVAKAADLLQARFVLNTGTNGSASAVVATAGFPDAREY